MRTTEHTGNGRRPLSRSARIVTRAACCCLVGVALLGIAGCSGSSKDGASSGDGSQDASSAVGAHMAGPAVDINVTREAVESKPQPPVLTTPESAVRSYLDWVSYAYRIGTSAVATPTMTPYEEVRVDSYTQYNLQKLQLIDQTLKSITFGKASITATKALVPAKEKWDYRYVSIKTAGKIVGGPFSASYDTTYTLVRSGQNWVVDSVEAAASGKVK